MQKYGFTKVFSIPLPSTDWLKFFRIYYLPFVIPWVVDQKCNVNVIIVFLALLHVINRVLVTVSVNYFEHCHPPLPESLTPLWIDLITLYGFRCAVWCGRFDGLRPDDVS